MTAPREVFARCSSCGGPLVVALVDGRRVWVCVKASSAGHQAPVRDRPRSGS